MDRDLRRLRLRRVTSVAVLAITLVIAGSLAVVVLETIPTNAFELCHQAFGPEWYPVYNGEGTCRNLNGTTRVIHFKG